MSSLELDLTGQHMGNLIRNLSGSNLEVDKIERDRTFFSEQLPHRSIEISGNTGNISKSTALPLD